MAYDPHPEWSGERRIVAAPLEPVPALIAAPDVPALALPQPRVKSALREYAEALGIALILALFIRSSVVQAFKIPSGSMLPTLQIGDHILVNKFIYGVRLPVLGTRVLPVSDPERGDVVVFVYPVDPSKDFIKRVVGVSGDVIQIRSKHVFINDEPWDDAHGYFVDGTDGRQATSPRDNFGPVTVPPGHIFVMGDNRDRSYDSRFWGFVDLNEVKGKATLVYWSWDGTDRWVRWDRVGEVIH
jgi:signal peptidase I